jgi:hypothetical protein
VMRDDADQLVCTCMEFEITGDDLLLRGEDNHCQHVLMVEQHLAVQTGGVN